LLFRFSSEQICTDIIRVYLNYTEVSMLRKINMIFLFDLFC